MALAREALRISTVKALRGRTWARVLDSEAGAIDDIAEGSTQPVIAVYTDDGNFGTGQAAFSGGGDQTLLIEIALTSRMKVDNEDAEILLEYDGARELAVGLIERQVAIALADPNNAWAQIAQKFMIGQGEFRSVRGTLMREGVRFAGRQLTLNVELPRDPAAGEPPRGVWLAFLAALDADADASTQAIADRFRTAIAGGLADAQDWQKMLTHFGYSLEVGRALGLVPPAGTEDVSPDFSPPPAGHPDADDEPPTFTPIDPPIPPAAP